MRHQRRLFVIAITGLVLILAVAAAVKSDRTPRRTFRVTFGLRDRQPTIWNGRIEVAGGDVISLTGWRFQRPDSVQGLQAWKCQTRNLIAPGHSYPVTSPHRPSPPAMQQPWPCGITVTVRGDEPTIKLVFRQAEIHFSAADTPLGQPRGFLDGQVEVQRLPSFSVIRPPAPPNAVHPVEDDYPSLWVDAASGQQVITWVAYQDSGDRVLLAQRGNAVQPWSEPLLVDGVGDHFRVAVAGQSGGTTWITWAAQKQHRWNLYGRAWKDGQLGNVTQLTDTSGPNLWHRMATDRQGRVWLVWQGFHNGHSHIFARYADGDGWHKAIPVTDGDDDQWDPSIAADPRHDRVWVGWDGYNGETYNVHVCSLAPVATPAIGPVLTPEVSPLFEAHANLACDGLGRVWVAWDEAGAQWGKDYGFLDFAHDYRPGTRLYASRRVRVKCLVDDRWLEPAAPLADVLPLAMQDYYELPQMQPDDAGRLWLIFRHRTCRFPRADGWAMQGRWDAYATAFLGDRWLPPTELPESGGRLDMRTSSQPGKGGTVWLAYATDNRLSAPPLLPRNLSLTVAELNGAPEPKPARLVERHEPLPAVMPVHPRERQQVARIRGYKIEHGGKTYHIYRGDIHRHTDISADGTGDGSLTDLHRYALDAAAMDYIFVTDHNMGQNNEYCWWRTQKANDLYTVPGSFISMYGYERSVPYPNGHRNVIWTQRGYRTLPVPDARNPKAMAEDTARLYAYLRRTNGICTSHTSATDQGTNWREHDDRLEPVVEIFQGYHTSYEAPNAPKTINAETAVVHGAFRPDGFVSQGLARGYRLGFQASSDHISTHTSYACIVAEEFSRVGLVNALKQRHTYAATDNIVLDVRMGRLGIMGDEVKTAEPALDVVVLGTGPIERADVIRNGVVVATQPGHGEEVRWHWKDESPLRGEQSVYYYVRVLQQDGQMAWGSPIWVVK